MAQTEATVLCYLTLDQKGPHMAQTEAAGLCYLTLDQKGPHMAQTEAASFNRSRQQVLASTLRHHNTLLAFDPVLCYFHTWVFVLFVLDLLSIFSFF